MRELTEGDIEALAIGAAILGTGGGGNPYISKLHCLQELRRGMRVPLIGLDELDDDAFVVSMGGIGAPVVTVEKLQEGREGERAVRALEEFCGRRVTAVIPGEIGGANAIAPIIAAGQIGVGVVDADGMGRAFPEMQMCTFSIYGRRSVPATLTDERGNIVIFRDAPSEEWIEKLVRASVIAMGGAAVGAEAPMSGRFVKRVSVPGTISQAIALGQIVLDAGRAHANPIERICAHEHGVHLMDAKIVDLKRHLKGGFSVGTIALEGIDVHAGSRAEVVFQNEFLLFRREGRVEVTVPDLIVILDVDTGHAITTDVLRYGQRVAIVALPCHPVLRTPEALAVVGPSAFGFEGVAFQPLPLPNAESLP